jgi:hypothetical protein
MKTPILFIFALTALFLVTVNSCTKTVTQTVDSTFRDTVRDTAIVPAGGAALRFISMFPTSIANSMDLTTDSGGSNRAYYTTNVTSPYYIQVPPSTPLTYYLFINQSTYLGPISLPSLAAGSITTVAVFDTNQGTVQIALGNDSAKSTSPPAGYCYLRFVNGVPDYPSPQPLVYLDLDGTDTSVFLSNGFDRPYYFKEISPYSLIPSGTHTVNLREDRALGNIIYTINSTFQSGLYYTAHITGTQAAGNVVFAIDAEKE